MGKYARVLLITLAVLSIGVTIRDFVVGFHAYQWDLRTYHAAGSLLAQGMNPYDFEQLESQESAPLYPFLYPVGFALAFVPLASLDPDTVLALWLALKVVALCLTLVVWRRDIAPTVDWGTFLVIALLVGHGAPLFDIRSGNIEMFQTLVLSVALAMFLRKRFAFSSVLIGLAASVKILPLAFLLLILMVREYRAALFGVLVFLVTLGTPFLLYPELVSPWLAAIADVPYAEWNDHSVSSLFRFQSEGWQLTPLARVTTAGLLLATVSIASWVMWRCRKQPRLVLEAFLLGYLAVLPRLLTYSAIPLAIALLLRGERRGYRLPLLVLLALPSINHFSFVREVEFPLPWSLVALAFLVRLALEVRNDPRGLAGEPGQRGSDDPPREFAHASLPADPAIPPR